MKTPRVEIDLRKITENTRALVGLLAARGISVTGVTKGVRGHPGVARAMLDGGAVGLADARLSNVRRMRDAGIGCPISLIRAPMRAEAEEVIRTCDISYNTEMETILGLAAAARRLGRIHNIVLVVEMGDRRDGILPFDVEAFAALVNRIPGVALRGIAANFACLGDAAPTADGMTMLARLARDVEGACGPCLAVVSGGNSSGIALALEAAPDGRVNNLRLGEAILLGRDPETGGRIAGLHGDAFCLVAEVIETRWKPRAMSAQPCAPVPFAPDLPCESPPCLRSVLAVGQQDTQAQDLGFPAGIAFVNATSDHTVIETRELKLPVGSEVRSGMTYTALMRAMSAPDVATCVLRQDPGSASNKERGPGRHLSLVG